LPFRRPSSNRDGRCLRSLTPTLTVSWLRADGFTTWGWRPMVYSLSPFLRGRVGVSAIRDHS